MTRYDILNEHKYIRLVKNEFLTSFNIKKHKDICDELDTNFETYVLQVNEGIENLLNQKGTLKSNKTMVKTALLRLEDLGMEYLKKLNKGAFHLNRYEIKLNALKRIVR